MILSKQVAVALEGSNPELNKVMLNVRKQVLRYELAKKSGTLKKTDQAAFRLF
jgi:hypothetical protein